MEGRAGTTCGGQPESTHGVDVSDHLGAGVRSLLEHKAYLDGLGDPSFDPILAALDAHGAVVYTHPTIHPTSRGIPLPYPGFMLEYPFDTTRMAANLIFTGALDRFPAHIVIALRKLLGRTRA